MIISQINLKNYRNYDSVNLKLGKHINIIIGDNAQGKTNLLEAVYFMSITKSYRTSDDSNLIKNGKDFFKICVKLKDDSIPIKLQILSSKKAKSLFYNDTSIKKVSKFIGLLNVIMMAPEDINIIKGTPSERRNFLNIELSKLSQNYINKYNEFNKILKMRNDYLKLLMTNSISDRRYFDILTEKLIDKAAYIYIERKNFIDAINAQLSSIYKDISGLSGLKLIYSPNLEIDEFSFEKISEILKKIYLKNYNKELSLGMTLYGPHRDDFSFLLNDDNIKFYGSQGQQKLAIIALKISLIKIFNDRLGNMPVLLLDDIFSELDRKKKNKIINYINNCGQVIITTNDIRDINRKKLENVAVFEVKNKKIIEKGDLNGK